MFEKNIHKLAYIDIEHNISISHIMSTQLPVEKDRNENIQKMVIEMQRDK